MARLRRNRLWYKTATLRAFAPVTNITGSNNNMVMQTKKRIHGHLLVQQKHTVASCMMQPSSFEPAGTRKREDARFSEAAPQLVNKHSQEYDVSGPATKPLDLKSQAQIRDKHSCC